MPEFVSRVVEWFQACSTGQKALIVIGALVVLAAVSPLVVLIAAVVLLISLVVLGLRMVRSGPLRGPAIIAAVSLVAVGLFIGISSAIYGGDPSQETTEEPVAEQEPAPDPAEEPEPEPEPIEVPNLVDYEVVGQSGNDEQGFSVRRWVVEAEDDSPGALCAIAQDAALDAGEGWDVVRVSSEAGNAYVRMTDAAPDYSELEGFEECPVPGGDTFIIR